MKTKVIFRKWKDTGDIIALFPEELWSRNGYQISSYMQIGQHSGADYEGVIRGTFPAKQEEYQELYRELQQIGYSNLRIMKKCRPNYSKLKIQSSCLSAK